MDSREFIKGYFSAMCEIACDISVSDVDKVIALLFDVWQRGGRVFICGNGGSASTATHFACDLAKSTIVDGKKRFKAHCLNDNIPLMSAIINDEGFDNLFYEQLKTHFESGDVLICISVHGGVGQDKAGLWSQNLLKAVAYAKGAGGKVIGFSGFDGGELKRVADVCIVVPVDSTPHVESFHLALGHLICDCLGRKIEETN